MQVTPTAYGVKSHTHAFYRADEKLGVREEFLYGSPAPTAMMKVRCFAARCVCGSAHSGQDLSLRRPSLLVATGDSDVVEKTKPLGGSLSGKTITE